MPLDSMLKGLYTVWDKYPGIVDRRALDDSSLNIYAIRLDS